MKLHISLVRVTRGRYEREWWEFLCIHRLRLLKQQRNKGFCFHIRLSVHGVREHQVGVRGERLSLQRCTAAVGLPVIQPSRYNELLLLLRKMEEPVDKL